MLMSCGGPPPSTRKPDAETTPSAPEKAEYPAALRDDAAGATAAPTGVEDREKGPIKVSDTDPKVGAEGRDQGEARLGPINPRIVIGRVQGADAQTNELIGHIARRRRTSLDVCLADLGQPSDTLHGEVGLEMTIDRRGVVRSVRIARNTVRGNALAQCFLRAAKNWSFSGLSINDAVVVPIEVRAPGPQRR